MKNAFGVNVPKPDPSSHSAVTPLSAPLGRNLPDPSPGRGSTMEQARPLSTLLQTLKSQANAALADDARIKREVDEARTVLSRTAEAASAALQRLAHAEWQLEEKWAQLASMLAEVKKLEAERHEALQLAQQLSSLDGAVEGLESVEVSLSDEPTYERAVSAQAEVRSREAIGEIRSALKQVVQALPSSRLTPR